MKKKMRFRLVIVLGLLAIGLVVMWKTLGYPKINASKVTTVEYVRRIESGPNEGFYYTPVKLTPNQCQRVLQAVAAAPVTLVLLHPAGMRGWLVLHYQDGTSLEIVLFGDDLLGMNNGDLNYYAPSLSIPEMLNAEVSPPPTTMSSDGN